MRILVLHDAIAAEPRPDELDTLAQARHVAATLAALGHHTECLPVDLDLAACRARIEARAPDLVFNSIEALAGSGRLLHVVPALLDVLGVPYTGCPAEALLLTGSKLLTKRWLRAHGLRGPAAFTIDELRQGVAVPAGRYILKSVWEHGSLGLDDGAVVEASASGPLLAALEARLPLLLGDGFAEQFVDGRELNAGLLGTSDGPRVLPVAEIVFEGYGARPRVLGFAAKWHPGSFEDAHTVRRFLAGEQDARLVERVTELARRCWDAFGLRGYARVDFRVDSAGEPWILEVNANPGLSPDAGYAAMLHQTGIAYAEGLAQIVADALRGRVPRPRAAPALHAQGTALPPGLRCTTDVTERDIARVRDLVKATGFFRDDEVAIAAELVETRVKSGLASGYHFLLLEQGERLLGYACYGATPCTVASWDLYWIAVDAACRGQGLGQWLLRESEARARALGCKRMYIETGSRTLYAPTRRFYLRAGYAEVAFLPDFYAPGDGKFVFCRAFE